MKLAVLRLASFGPFSEVELDFSRGEPALHVVFGPNEAGKSTALRAISDLLFGIPERTRDAHTHAALRIGARLIAQDGREIDIARRKGRKNTLLDASGDPLPEEVLLPFLGGVGAQGFKLGFGLDAARLRQGAEALLAGDGAVGQILFDAATGGASVERVMGELRRQADELFKPRAKNPRINAAIAEYKAAKDKLRDRVHLPEAWERQQAALARARAERAELEGAQGELGRERLKLERAKLALPQLARHREARVALEALGPVPVLDRGAREERERLSTQLAEVRSALAQLEPRITDLKQRSGQVVVPAALVEIDAARIFELSQRLGSQRKARADLPKVRAQLDEQTRQAEAIAARLGADVAEAKQRFRLTTAQSARIQELCTQQPADPGELQAEVEARAARHAAAQERVAELPPGEDTSELARVVEGARKLESAAERRGEHERALAKIAQKAGRLLASHAPYVGDLAGVLSLALPPEETIDRFAEEHQTLAREREQVAQEQRDVAQRTRDAVEALETLVRQAEVPTLEELAHARARRDAGWHIVKQGLLGGAVDKDARAFDPERALPDAFEDAQTRADTVADRLRREATDVARRAQLEAERSRLDVEREELEARAAAQQSAAADFERRWHAAWKASGLTPLTPTEMRGFAKRHAELCELAERHAEIAAERDALTREEAERVAELSALLGAGGSLAELIRRAELRLEQALEVDRERERRAQAQQAAAEELSTARQRAERQRAEREEWRRSFGDAVAPLGFSADSSPREVLAVLSEARDLFAKLEQAESEGARIAGIERDAREFEADVHALVATAAPELAELPPEAAADRLVAAHREALTARDAQEQRARELSEKEDELGALRAREQGLSAALAELCRRAGAGSLDELREMEERAEQRAKLLEERQGIERALTEASDGLTVAELERELAGVSRDDAKLRLPEIERELEELDEKREALLGHIATLEQALLRFESTEGEEAALELEAKAAAVQADVERWVRLHLATAVLSREIERYRQENQGPVLERASAIYSRLTHGRYVGLTAEVGSGDRVVLHARRADEKPVELDGLSDGARDQLYLALRLATLERHAQTAEPLPLVLDDVLASFDEERTAAALSVLADVAQTTQVLLFTHHAHLVEQAKSVLGKAQLRVHELRRTGPGPELRASS